MQGPTTKTDKSIVTYKKNARLYTGFQFVEELIETPLGIKTMHKINAEQSDIKRFCFFPVTILLDFRRIKLKSNRNTNPNINK